MASPAVAWTAPSRVRMVDEAVKMMPASLRLALEHYREPLVRGMLDSMTAEDDPHHLPADAGGTLDREIERRAKSVIDAVETAASFAEVARAFGTLAHFVADAGFPPGAAGKDGARIYRPFASFCESRRERFPLVFYGHPDADLARDDFAAFARRVIAASRAEFLPLARAYAEDAKAPDPAAFDDRSVPFAVASLAYSRSVTDIVRAWIAAWRLANGDLRRTPYLDKPIP